MNAIKRVSGAAPVFLPVIHPVTSERAMASIVVALEAGAQGVFLINQGMDDDDVLALSGDVARAHPDLWIGLNLLGQEPADVIAAAPAHVGGVWSDNAGVLDPSEPKRVRAAKEKLGRELLYFGGVAFNYQGDVSPEELPVHAQRAMPFVDVVTTSGGSCDACTCAAV